MKFRLKTTFIFIFTVLLVFLVGCTSNKKPTKGYISEERVMEIIEGFDSNVVYSKYNYEGNLNYFNHPDELVPRTVSKKNVTFNDSLDAFSDSCASYYLRLPLHLNKSNWTSTKVNDQGLSLSTKYQLESKIYRPAGLDEVYYYESDDGGLIVRVFGVNKALKIKKPSDIECHGKWNIEVVYDKNGYLISEKFETVNTKRASDNDCCYGQATYSYIV